MLEQLFSGALIAISAFFIGRLTRRKSKSVEEPFGYPQSDRAYQ